MKLSKLLITIGLSLLTIYANGQEIFMGQAKKFNIRHSEYGILGKINNRNIVYRLYDKDVVLDIYTDSMRLIESVPLNFLPNKTIQFSIFKSQDFIHCYAVSDERGTYTVYGYILKEDGSIVQNKKKILEEKKNWIATSKNPFIFKQSNNKEVTAIMTHGGKQKDEFKYYVLDAQLNTQWQGASKITDEGLGEFIAYNYLEVSNDGNIYFPSFSTNNAGTLYNVDIIQLSPNFPQEYKHITIGGHSTFFNDLIIRINDFDNYCQVSGTYKSNKNGKIEGLYNSRIPLSNLSAPHTALTEFTDSFLKTIKPKSYKKAFNDYRIQDIIFRKDGGYLVIAEEQNFEIKNVYNGGYMGYNMMYNDATYYTTKKEYVFGNIIIINLDKDGNILWSEHIRKSQRSIDDNGELSSFTLMNSGANLVFLYNLFNRADHSLGLSSVDPTGLMQMSRLNPNQTYEEWLIRNGKQTAPLEVIIPVVTSSELNFALVNFK